ncbi:MAG TPA: hypothetical protein VNA29_08185 [Sphingomicrobium sp.]|nr:hypothetical protein [Sphingomicrobium sp.]
MTDDLDRRLGSLFAEPPPPPDPAFADRIVALAAHDQAMRRAHRRALIRIGKEALGLGTIVSTFVLLARYAPDGSAAGMGDSLALGSPAMLGFALLAIWGLAGTRLTSSA